MKSKKTTTQESKTCPVFLNFLANTVGGDKIEQFRQSLLKSLSVADFDVAAFSPFQQPVGNSRHLLSEIVH